MNEKQAEELLATLKERAWTLQELHERIRIGGSSWTDHQLELFLGCVHGVTRDGTTGAYRSAESDPDEELRDAVVACVRSFAGRPMPAVEIRRRLPDRFVTTDEQVLALARRTRGLEVIGPGLIRIAL